MPANEISENYLNKYSFILSFSVGRFCWILKSLLCYISLKKYKKVVVVTRSQNTVVAKIQQIADSASR